MKITIVLPDGTRQPIEVSEQATLRRLLPALAAKIALPRRDESGTAVAYYASHQDQPLPDDQPLSTLGVPEDALLRLHPVTVPDPREAIEPELEVAPDSPAANTRPRHYDRQRQRPFRLPRFIKVGCFIILLAFCCGPIAFFSWLVYVVDQETPLQFESAETAETELHTPVASGNELVAPHIVTYTNHTWDFAVIDATYAATVNRLLMVSSNPHMLHIYDPLSEQDIQIPLSRQPTAVTLSQDGSLALVAHSDVLSLINITTYTIQTIFVEAPIYDAARADNGWLYLTSSDDFKARLYGLEPETENEKVLELAHDNDVRILQLAADGRSLYSTTQGSEPGRLEKIDITRGEPQFMYDSGDVADTCDQVWLAEDGRFAFTGCGHIWRLADLKRDDMVLLGNFFTEPERITSLTYSTAAEHILVITETNDNQVFEFDVGSFALLATRSLPEGTHGRYLFIGNQATQYYAIVQSEDGQFSLITGNL